jgi:hypothetical protein
MPRFFVVGIALTALGLSTVTAQQPSPAVGLWQTEGYGLVFDVRQDSVIGYEITKVSCIPTTRAVTKPAPPAGALGAFGQAERRSRTSSSPGRHRTTHACTSRTLRRT